MAKKSKPKRDSKREKRIENEIIVDCYDEHERAMGWYGYLEEELKFPFTADCVSKREISPLRVDTEVEVFAMGPEDECEKEPFVMIRWEKDGLAVPLAQLKPIHHSDEQTKQAIADWHYWVAMGYQF